MNFIIICNEYPPSPGGGIGTFYHLLARKLVGQGHNVTVGGIYPSFQETSVIIEDGVTIHRLPASKVRKGTYYFNMFFDRLRIGRWVKRQLKEPEATIIDTADYQGWLWGVPAIAPRVLRVHGADTLFFPLLGMKPNRIKKYLEVASIRKADYIISSSNFMTEQILPWVRKPNGVDRTIYNMVDTQAFYPNPALKRNVLTVASVASLSIKKGVFQLLEAWRTVHQKFPKAKLLFYGRDLPHTDGGSTLNHMRAKAEEYSLLDSVEFLGSVPYSNLLQVLQREGFFVFPTYMEAHPRVWLEAMSTAAPIIGSSRGPGPEVIETWKNGVLIDPDNIEELSLAILHLLRDPELAHNLGQAARVSMEKRFSIEVILKQNLDFYDLILKG